MVWGIAGYALGVLPELIMRGKAYHLYPGAMLPAALTVAGVTGATLLALVATFLRGSSRGHRVLVESALLPVLGLPISIFQVVADTNRALDDAPSETAVRGVTRREKRAHRTRRRRRSYSYHVHLAASADAGHSRLPATLKTHEPLCRAAEAHGSIEVELGPGRWSHRWLRSIRAGSMTWTAP